MTSSESSPGASPGGGPALQLLAAGLQLWIRSQCEAVDSLELQLHGSALQLLRGRLEGVSLRARRVVYAGLQIERVELRSEAMTVPLGRLLRGQELRLEQPFAIRGRVCFSADGLTRSLLRSEWRWLAEQLCGELLGPAPLEELRIERDSLVFVAREADGEPPLELETRPTAVEGAVELHGPGGGVKARLPVDPDIHIASAGIEDGLLQLQGEARVSP